MTTIFFTNTNQVGNGSLYQTLLDAQDGDVVMPDTTVFSVGERVVIDFVEPPKIERPITLDAGNTRLILRKTTASAVPKDILIDCVYSTVVSFNARGIAFNGRVLVGGNGESFMFDNCVFGGFDTVRNSVHTRGTCNIEFNDCAFICGSGSPFFGTLTNSSYRFTRCTIAANKANETSSGRNAATYVDCVDEPDLATAGFANVPASLDDVDVTKWEEYDFTPLPSSPYATGATTGAGAIDIHGNARGWNNSGEISYALGAYEVIIADYYLRTGAEASFNNVSSWATNKGLTESPVSINSGVFYIDKNATVTDLPPNGSEVVIAGKTHLTINMNSEGAVIGSSVTLNEQSKLTSNALVNAISIYPNANTDVLYAPNAILTALKSPDLYFYHRAHLSRLNADLGAKIHISSNDDLILRIDEIQTSSEINIDSVSTGRGYVTTPVGVDTSKLAISSSNVVLSAYGGDVSEFKATVERQNFVKLTGVQSGSVPVLLEYQKHNGEWDVINSDFHLTEIGVEIAVPQPGKTLYRVFDGENFFSDYAWTVISSGLQFKVISSVVGAESAKENWQCLYQVIAVDESNIVRVGQSITVLARVFDAFDNNTPLVNDGSNVESIEYSVEKSTKDVFTPIWKPVEGHTSIVVDSTALLESTQKGDAWTIDSEGYNFVLVPDTREHVLFSDVGSYRIVVKITLSEGNPVVFYSYVNVVDAK